jgi:hypothetical protein
MWLIRDILMARVIVSKAQEQGLGTEIAIDKPDAPLPMLEV